MQESCETTLGIMWSLKCIFRAFCWTKDLCHYLLPKEDSLSEIHKYTWETDLFPFLAFLTILIKGPQNKRCRTAKNILGREPLVFQKMCLPDLNFV